MKDRLKVLLLAQAVVLIVAGVVMFALALRYAEDGQRR